MAGMLQIITWILCFYLVVKGIEILQIALTSNRESRAGPIILGAAVLLICVVAAVGFVWMQEQQAMSISNAFND